MTEPDALPEIGVIAKLQLEPGDILAVIYPEGYSMSEVDFEHTYEVLGQALPAGVKPIIFEGGVQLSVIRPADA